MKDILKRLESLRTKDSLEGRTIERLEVYLWDNETK